jgi:hypothetical protein
MQSDLHFHLSLFLLQSEKIKSNFMIEEDLLTMIVALNIAVDGSIPFPDDDEYAGIIASDPNKSWQNLNYFELQNGSVIQKAKQRDYHKPMSGNCGIMFFYRYERALELMATTPQLIDATEHFF